MDVHTNITAPTINAVDRKQKQEFLTDLGNIANSVAMAKQAGLDPEERLPIKENISDLAASYNLKVQENSENDETE